jgi:hypothetical protein
MYKGPCFFFVSPRALETSGPGLERRQGCRIPLAIRDGREGAGGRPGSGGVAVVPRREGCHGGGETVAKGGTAEEARLRRNLLGTLIKYIFSPIAFSSLPYSLAPRLISLAPPATWEELWGKNLASVLEYMRSYRYLLPLTFESSVLLEVLERFQVHKTLCAR